VPASGYYEWATELGEYPRNLFLRFSLSDCERYALIFQASHDVADIGWLYVEGIGKSVEWRFPSCE
jgi:hypothetical protein